MAPEVFRSKRYNEKCDVYSWSIILWEVLARELPFHFADSVEQIQWAVHSSKRPPLLSECPQVIEELMTKCWANEPSVRPSMADVESRVNQLIGSMSNFQG
jgi:mitogen-activated protein kinase kinase kinase 7